MYVYRILLYVKHIHSVSYELFGVKTLKIQTRMQTLISVLFPGTYFWNSIGAKYKIFIKITIFFFLQKWMKTVRHLFINLDAQVFPKMFG